MQKEKKIVLFDLCHDRKPLLIVEKNKDGSNDAWLVLTILFCFITSRVLL